MSILKKRRNEEVYVEKKEQRKKDRFRYSGIMDMVLVNTIYTKSQYRYNKKERRNRMPELTKQELLKELKKLEETNKKLIEANENLREENEKISEKLNEKRRKKKRAPIKTTKEEIVDYWERIEDECGLSVDWLEAKERCWRCGCEANLERCHIIPEPLGGKDEPSNLVLLCKRCHIDAPNVESKTFMWDWIRANGTSFYDTFWKIRAQKEYEFTYHKAYIQELEERDILSPRDFSILMSIPIGRSINHFAHPWKNDSTNAGLLRMRLEAFDKRYPNRKPKSKAFREKEEKFDKLVWELCDIAKKYHWDVWEGRTSNPFSITLNSFMTREKQKTISIKLGKDNQYRACFKQEINPNNNKASEYTIELGKEEKNVADFVQKEVEKFTKQNGKKEKQDYVFTINPMYRLRKE